MMGVGRNHSPLALWPKRHGRGIFLAITLFLGMLFGCSRSDRKADLIVGVERGPYTLDPRIGSDQGSERVYQLVHRGLFRIGDDLNPEGDLVDHWEQLSSTRYLFHLKSGVRFETGAEVLAKDVRYTLDSIRTGEVASFRTGDLDRIEEVVEVGRRTVGITLKEPFSPLPSVLTLGILPEGTPACGPCFPGCGPYRVHSVIPDQWVILEANPFHAKPPRSPTLALKVIPDAVVRSLELRRGGVDLVLNDLHPDTLAYFQGAPGFEVLRSPGSSYRYIGLNLKSPLLSRAEVRAALALSVNREEILATILRGFGRPASGLLCPENAYHDPGLKPVPFEPRRAEKILDEAQCRRGSSGLRFRLTYKTSNDKLARQVAVAVQRDLFEVGIDLDIETLEWGTFYGDVKSGNFELFGLTWIGITDPDALRLRFSSASVPPAGLNRGRYENPEVDILVAEGALESDPLIRRQLYGRVQRVLADDCPYIHLWHPDNVAVCRTGLSGVRIPPDGGFRFLVNVGRE